MADQNDPGANTYKGNQYQGEYKGDKAGTAPSNVKAGGFSAAAAGAKKFRNQRPDESIQDYIAERKKFQADQDASASQSTALAGMGAK